jgi:hypothetical protein
LSGGSPENGNRRGKRGDCSRPLVHKPTDASQSEVPRPPKRNPAPLQLERKKKEERKQKKTNVTVYFLMCCFTFSLLPYFTFNKKKYKN